MDEREWLAERFEEHRTRLRAVAYRMLGSLSEATNVTIRDGQPFAITGFTIKGRRIVEMDILADPVRLRRLDPRCSRTCERHSHLLADELHGPADHRLVQEGDRGPRRGFFNTAGVRRARCQ